MTDRETTLAELAELSRKATQGEWFWSKSALSLRADNGQRGSSPRVLSEDGTSSTAQDEADGRFAAAAVNFVRQHLALASSTQTEAAGQAAPVSLEAIKEAVRSVHGRYKEKRSDFEATELAMAIRAMLAAAPHPALPAVDASADVDVALKEVERLYCVHEEALSRYLEYNKSSEDDEDAADLYREAKQTRRNMFKAIRALANPSATRRDEDAARVCPMGFICDCEARGLPLFSCEKPTDTADAAVGRDAMPPSGSDIRGKGLVRSDWHGKPDTYGFGFWNARKALWQASVPEPLEQPADTAGAAVGVLPKVIEAADFGARGGFALTCEWPDGSETIEKVSEQAAALLGYVPDGWDEDEPPTPAPVKSRDGGERG